MKKKMNVQERRTMVCAMEFIARNLNDEDDLFNWLLGGVADGDFDYEAMVTDFNSAVEFCDDYYTEDENFSELMGLFLRCMRRAARPEWGGGLYCDGIVSK